MVTSSRPPRRHAEAGSAAILGLSAVMLILVAGFASATISGLYVGQRRAAAAADLAALAGASAFQQGRPPCDAAAGVAAANRARLTSCDQRASVVTVTATSLVEGAFGKTWHVDAQARAGPAW
jgi:secretion/DNA translocation related TadE-like protein